MSHSKELSPKRLVGESIGEFDHVVFLGTFNADPFRPKIEKWLPSLDLSGAALMVADNKSTDGTVRWMSELVGSLNCFAVISVNERNFGGYGNLATNLPKFDKASWITTLHQDDEYLPQHVQNHRRVIKGSSSDLGMICSEAASVSPDGKRIGYPRAHWLLEQKADPATVFLAHLKNHAYPFSGATFLKRALLDFPIPWHSTAFPDTEIVMKLAIDYRVEFADGVTVKYLENPHSESHSLNALHRDYGAFQALLRVFAHPNYAKLCQLIDSRDVPAFLKALDEGMSQRFQSRLYSDLVRQAAFEITAQHLGTGPEMASYLSRGYIQVGDSRALEVLSSLGASFPTEAHLEESQLEVEKKPSTESSNGLGLVVRIVGILPRALRRYLFKGLMATRVGRTLLKNWDFDWSQR